MAFFKKPEPETSDSPAIRHLKQLQKTNDPQYLQMIQDQDRVHAEYGRRFSLEQLPQLTAEDFKSFLLYQNNRHWWNIHRQQTEQTTDMDALRSTLSILVDESKPLMSRLNHVMPAHGANKPVPGLGRAVITPILHVVYPERYGVWNQIAENAMANLRLFPSLKSAPSFGAQYIKVNRALLDTAAKAGVDLWTLDSLWWLNEKERGRSDQSEANTPRRSSSKMTTRGLVLQAFENLEKRSGRKSFHSDRVVAEVRRLGATQTEGTIKTHIISHMCVDAPNHHSKDLRRVGDGKYARDDSTHMPNTTTPVRKEPRSETGDASKEWFWEGNVQAAMVAHLASEGWSILSVADTASRQHGIDIIATREGVRLGVEVKGYPSEFYARGEKQGQRKPTVPSVQARAWLNDLVVSSMALRNGTEVAEVLMCVPEISTYRERFEKFEKSLALLKLPVAYVSEDGSVDVHAFAT